MVSMQVDLQQYLSSIVMSSPRLAKLAIHCTLDDYILDFHSSAI